MVLLATVIWLVIATQAWHSGQDDATLTIAVKPAPSVGATAPPATPMPSPATLDAATGLTAHGALIAWIIFVRLPPFLVVAGTVVHARHRAKLLELDHPPLRNRELTHRAYEVKALEARRGWLPES